MLALALSQRLQFIAPVVSLGLASFGSLVRLGYDQTKKQYFIYQGGATVLLGQRSKFQHLFCVLLAAWLFGSGVALASGALNDTGIDFCGDATTNTANCTAVGIDGGTFPRQDARYGRDAQAAAGTLTKVGAGGKGFDFSKIANNGTVLAASAALGTGATDWACTRDNVTGLIWEVKTTSGLRSQSHTYTWYSSNTATNGGSVGTASTGTCFVAGRCDTEKYTADVNAAGLCGATAWRMPTIKELVGISDIGRSLPAIDPTYFPNTSSLSTSKFWSTTPNSGYAGQAWHINFGSGIAYSGNKADADYVRLVLSGQ
jgi:hypothetical protein